MASEDMFANSEEMTLEDKINDVSSKVNIDSDTEMEQGEENRKDSDKSEEIDGTDQTVGEPEHNTLISDLIKSKGTSRMDVQFRCNFLSSMSLYQSIHCIMCVKKRDNGT